MYAAPGQYIDLGYSTWSRSNAGYEWLPDEDDLESATLVERAETTNYVSYEPFSVPTLFLQFAELDPDDRKSLLEFANQHGPLVVHVNVNQAIPSPPGETLEFWQMRLVEMKCLVSLWQWTKENNLTMLSKVITWEQSKNGTPQVLYSLNGENPHPITEHPAILARFKPGDVRFPALHLISSIVMEKLRDWPVNPFLFVTPQGELLQRFVPETLLAAMWFQVFQAVSGEKRFKRCAVCHTWEDVTKNKATWTRHPECAGRERVKKYRENKELAQKND